MKDKDFLNSLKGLLEKNNHQVTEIEMTSGNYDDKGNLIVEEIPTLTTDLCEIGVFYNKVCYFTIILYSDSFSKELFDLIKYIDGVHIYGFKNFLEDYYPSGTPSIENLDKKIKEEKYFQIQFNFDLQISSPESILKKYLELKSLFKKTSTQIVNQMTQDLRNSE